MRARITITGLVFCSIDPPEIDPTRGYEPTPDHGLWIDPGEGPANEDARSRLPEPPDGCFLDWFFVQQWNRFIHIGGRRSDPVWSLSRCHHGRQRGCFRGRSYRTPHQSKLVGPGCDRSWAPALADPALIAQSTPSPRLPVPLGRSGGLAIGITSSMPALVQV